MSSALPTWPVGLPTPLLGRSHTIDPRSEVTRMETGRARVRPQDRECFEVMQATWNFTAAEYNTFQEFFITELEHGQKSFEMTTLELDPEPTFIRQYTRELAFLDAKYSFSGSDNLFVVEAVLELDAEDYEWIVNPFTPNADPFPDFPSSTVVTLEDSAFVASLQSCLGGSFSESISATSVPEDYPLTFRILSGYLPPGIEITEDGTQAFFAGVPTALGSYRFTFRARTAGGSTKTKIYTMVIGEVATTSLDLAYTGDVYSQTLTAAEFTGVLTWGIAAGSLPVGLSLDSETGVISGTPSVDGISNFTVYVQVGDHQCTKELSIEVVTCEITTETPLPEALTTAAYSVELAVTNLPGTLVWSIAAGALPDGLSLNSATGFIEGTATTDGTAAFTVAVSNGEHGCQKDFSLPVRAPGPGAVIFLDLVWEQQSLLQSNGATSSASGSGYTFQSVSNSPAAESNLTPPNDYVARDTNTYWEGEITYQGPAVDCTARIAVTGTAYYNVELSATTFGNSGCDAACGIYIPSGPTLFSRTFFFDENNGTIDVNFTIPECLVPTTIIVYALTSANTNAGTDISGFYPNQTAPTANMSLSMDLSI